MTLETVQSEASATESSGHERKLQSLTIRRLVKGAEFAFGCDPRSEYRLEIDAPEFCPYEIIVSATDGVFPRVDAVLKPSHTVMASVSPLEALNWLEAYQAESKAEGSRRMGFVLVELGRPRKQQREQIWADVDPEGRLAFRAVDPGNWALWIRSPLRPKLVAKMEVGKERVVRLPPIDVEYLRPTHVRGRIVCDSPNLRPVTILASAQSCRVRAEVATDDTFEFLIPAGDYWIRTSVEVAGTLHTVTNRPLRVEGGGEVFEVVEAQLRSVSVRVTNSLTDAAVVGAELSIDEERLGGYFQTFKTDNRGYARLFPCPVGEFGISVKGDSTSSWRNVARTVASETDETTISVSL